MCISFFYIYLDVVEEILYPSIKHPGSQNIRNPKTRFSNLSILKTSFYFYTTQSKMNPMTIITLFYLAISLLTQLLLTIIIPNILLVIILNFSGSRPLLITPFLFIYFHVSFNFKCSLHYIPITINEVWRQIGQNNRSWPLLKLNSLTLFWVYNVRITPF